MPLSGKDATYGDAEYPNSSALVFQKTWDFKCDPASLSLEWTTFDRPVSLLVFSNDFIHYIGVDNLTVEACCPNPGPTVPAPGAIVLAGLGLGLIGRLKRRFA